MKKRFITNFTILVSSALLSTQSNGADGNQAIKLGEGRLYLGSGLSYQREENRNFSVENPLNTSSYTLSASLDYVADVGTTVFESNYDGNYTFSNQPDFDSNEHNLSIDLKTAPTKRLRGGTRLTFTQTNDDIAAVIPTSDETQNGVRVFQNTRLAFNTTYGARSAKGNIAASVTFLNHTEANDLGLNDNLGNYDLLEPSAELSLRISSDTRLTFGIRHGFFDYDSASDRERTSLLAGVRFAATGSLTGIASVGSASTSFDDRNLRDTTRFVTNAALVYKPQSGSTFSLRFSRRLNNQENDSANFSAADTVFNNANFSWKNDWNYRFSTTASVRIRETVNECPIVSISRRSWRLQASYNLSQRLSVGASFSTESRNQDICDSISQIEALEDARSETLGVNIRFKL